MKHIPNIITAVRIALVPLLLFTAPVLLIWKQISLLWLICAVAFLSAAEETVIHISSAQLDVNRRSIFMK